MRETWPELPLEAWTDTYATLHLWLQIVGKIRLVQMPWINHSWHATLYVSARGLTTSVTPHGDGAFEIEFDFIDHVLVVRSADGRAARVTLEAQTVSAFYARVMAALATLDLPVRIHRRPCEIPDSLLFHEDEVHRSYDPEYAHRFWRILVHAQRVFTVFRSRFIGKCSPVHFFWGAPDLAVTRFSGRRAPLHAGGVPNLADRVVQEAYSHEVSSCGFWPGGGPVPYPAFYAYAYPEPEGFKAMTVEPADAFYSQDLQEFVLPYDAVRRAADPDGALLAFLQTTYNAAANLGRWDRLALEKG
jgi:hypothetical protein